jgi:hypothetical protein
MLIKLKITIILVSALFVSFILTTIVTDTLARYAGFYTQGEADSACVASGDCE